VSAPYIPRLVDSVLPRILQTLPAVSLVGPRACGKTTSAARLASSVSRLDREAEAAAFKADPDAALARLLRPALLDEWQQVPGTLNAVKRSVDDDPEPGQFLLTGSVKVGKEYTWPATGRVVRQAMYGLTQREINRFGGPLFAERVRNGVRPLLDTPRSSLTLFDYLEIAQTGGFPDIVAHRRKKDARGRWLDSYLAELRTNDIKMAGSDPNPGKFASFIEAVAINSSRIVEQATLRDAVGITKNTAAVYEDLLETVFFSERVPAWRTDRLDRLAALPKRYVLDTALLMHFLGVDVDEAAHDPVILGAVIDTFVAAQLRPELAIQVPSPSLLHLRDKGGRHEIDMILQFPRRRIVGIEVKATAAPALDDARHLVWLRDQIGTDFLGGVVLHTGPMAFQLSDRIVAAPISCLWS